jgi:hypothetical protein
MTTSSHISALAQVAPRQVDVRRAIPTVIATAVIVVAGVAWCEIIGVALGSVG